MEFSPGHTQRVAATPPRQKIILHLAKQVKVPHCGAVIRPWCGQNIRKEPWQHNHGAVPQTRTRLVRPGLYSFSRRIQSQCHYSRWTGNSGNKKTTGGFRIIRTKMLSENYLYGANFELSELNVQNNTARTEMCFWEYIRFRSISV